jgi:tetratricopeptide (TPR) repeat protein
VISTLDEVFSLVLSARQRRPAPSLPRRLNSLFRELQSKTPPRAADDIEDLIWAIWISHEDVRAAASMHAAMEAMRAGETDLARPILDRLVDTYPDWPEAWNKRAILSVMEERDALGLADIGRTLRLEPRHFGAISGFAQVCVRSNRFREARAAFQMALQVNPHLEGVAEAIAELADAGEVLH